MCQTRFSTARVATLEASGGGMSAAHVAAFWTRLATPFIVMNPIAEVISAPGAPAMGHGRCDQWRIVDFSPTYSHTYHPNDENQVTTNPDSLLCLVGQWV